MKKVLLVLCALLLASTAYAGEKEEQQVRDAFAKLAPSIQVDSVRESVVPGLYEVLFGSRIVYLTGDGKFLLQGNIMDIESGKDLSEAALSVVRSKTLNSLKEEDLVVFAPKETLHTVTVFTDIDCGYCRKMHAEMKDYNDLGIKIRYVAYPRAGVGSESFNKADTVWCAEDRQEAMTIAKENRSLANVKAQADCVSPVADQYRVGRQLNLQGTPATFLENGARVGGYLSASDLMKQIQQQ